MATMRSTTHAHADDDASRTDREQKTGKQEQCVWEDHMDRKGDQKCKMCQSGCRVWSYKTGTWRYTEKTEIARLC